MIYITCHDIVPIVLARKQDVPPLKLEAGQNGLLHLKGHPALCAPAEHV